jgi:GDP-L-fucose synthase
MMLKGARVLVAGGAGFLGANLIKGLTKAGACVRATIHDRPAISEIGPVDYRHADLTRAEDCRAAVDGADVVFMCAANTSGAAVMTLSPLTHVTPNVLMNTLMLDAAYQARVKKFVFISSSAAYPPSDERPVREDEMFTGDPYDVYFAVGWMKRCAEALCRVYAEKIPNPMATLVIRPSNCYGPYDKFDFSRSHVTSALVRRVVERQSPLVVWGTGDDVRDLIYIDDFVDAVLRATELPGRFLAINIASGCGYSIRQVLDTMLRVDGWSDADVRYDASKPRTIAARNLDVTLARERLGRVSPTSLEDGLARTLDWYRANRGTWTK